MLTCHYKYEIKHTSDARWAHDRAARVATALNKAGATINQTCGLHVHFDAAELSVNDVRTICERYAKHEAQIDAFSLDNQPLLFGGKNV